MSQNPSDTFKTVSVKVDQILKALSETQAIAILRKCPQPALSNVVSVLEQTGFQMVEIISKYSELIIGAGTGTVRNVVKKLANTDCAVVRKASQACTAQKVLQNSLLDSALLKIQRRSTLWGMTLPILSPPFLRGYSTLRRWANFKGPGHRRTRFLQFLQNR